MVQTEIYGRMVMIKGRWIIFRPGPHLPNPGRILYSASGKAEKFIHKYNTPYDRKFFANPYSIFSIFLLKFIEYVKFKIVIILG